MADDVGTGGLYVRLDQRLELGTTVAGVVRLPPGATIAARARVVRVERAVDGSWGTALKFTRARMV